jgi:hypothetical protein
MDHGNVPIHVLTYGPSGQDIAFGYVPEGSDAPEFLALPTPGSSNDGSPLFSPVCINEFLTSSLAGGVDDWVELYNRGPDAVDISGWHVSDSVKDTLRYTFPAGTVIPAGGYLVRDETQLGFGFDLNGADAIVLTAADGTTGQDYFDQGPQHQDVSQGRLPSGSANWYFFQVLSMGGTNYCPAALPALGVVTGLQFLSQSEMTWDPLAGAEDYDVVRGDLQTLRSTSGDFSAAVTACLSNNVHGAGTWDLDAALPGGGFFYLVRGATYWCDRGTYDSAGAGQAGERDVEIGASSGTCP